MNNNTNFYLSLNMIFNSLRFEESDHLIKKDSFLDYLLAVNAKEQQRKNGQKEADKQFIWHICDYCFIFLTRFVTIQISKKMCSADDIMEEDGFYDKCKEIVDVNRKFLKELGNNRSNTDNNTASAIQKSEYEKYIKTLVPKTLLKRLQLKVDPQEVHKDDLLKAIQFQNRHEILTSMYFPPKFELLNILLK